MTASQESNTLPASEEITEAQDGNYLSSIHLLLNIHKGVCSIRGIEAFGLVVQLFYYNLTDIRTETNKHYFHDYLIFLLFFYFLK